jgi:restriction system protein
MAVPDYQTFMLPVLRYAGSHDEIPMKSLLGAMAKEFALNDKDLGELLPSGVSTTFGSRVGWACTYLKKAGLLQAPRRGYIKISPRGQDVLSKKPSKVDVNLLRQFPEFVIFHSPKSAKEGKFAQEDLNLTQTPQEQIETSYRELREALASELLDKLKQSTPSFFERIVVELLVRMGYGGSLKDAGKAIGKSGDEALTESSRKINSG